MLREERLLAAYLAEGVGGPARYLGRDMVSAHRELGITARDWQVFLRLLAETIETLGIPAQESRELVAMVAGLEADVAQH